MQISLNLPKQGAASKASKADKHVEGTAWSVARYGLIVFLAAALVLAGASWVSFDLSRQQRAEASAAYAHEIATGVARELGGYLTGNAAILVGIAAETQLGVALIEQDRVGLDERSTELARLFDGALRVRILEPGINKPDEQQAPYLSYASLDLLRAAEKAAVVPAAEVHQFGSDHQHVAMAWRVSDRHGDAIGLIHVSLPVSRLRDSLDAIKPAGGYVELQQLADQRNVLSLYGVGDAGSKRGTPQDTVMVPGSRWQVASWPAPAPGLLTFSSSAVYWVVAGVALALLALAVLLLFRRFGEALRVDQISIIGLVEDMTRGRLRREYPARITELNGTVESLLQIARDSVGRGTATGEGVSPAIPEAEVVTDASLLATPGDGGLLVDEHASPGMETISRVQGDASLPAEIFRLYDIRGVVGQTLMPEYAFEIGRAIGSESIARDQRSVIIGRDGRLSGPELAEALSRGILSTGCDVIDIGRVPTPMLYFATHYLGSASGVIVTGSHNPPEYNGMKIVIGGTTLSGEDIQALRRRIDTGNLDEGDGTLRSQNIISDYIDRIATDVHVARPLTVVVDCGNGVAGAVAPDLLRRLGCTVIELFCDVDGNFPNHHPDPSRPENLTALISAVREHGADVGVAFDGDGDRIGVVDAGGNIIWPDRQMMLYAIDILARQPGADIIYDVKCSRHLGRVILDNGGRPLMWKTGHSIIKAKIRETGALLAGEMSGHIFFKDRWYGFDDAMYTSARLLEILSMDARSSTEVFAELPNSVNTPELNVPMAEGESYRLMERLLASANFPGAKLTTIDGLRVDFEDAWGLVRASNTTPCLVMRFEADNTEALHRVQAEFRKLLLGLDPELELPF